MRNKGENIRLVLTNNDNKSQPNLLCCCTPNRGKCFWLSLLQVCLFILFLVFLIFIAIRVVQIQKQIKEEERESLQNTIPGSDFCKAVNADNMTLLALGYLKGVKEEKNSLEVMNKIYYVTDRWFTDQEACAIESILRLLQDKSIFIIEIGNLTRSNYTKTDYVDFLREQYTNLNRIKSSPTMFFKGSPFQNYIKTFDDFSLFAAKVLLVWQFGGTVLSPNFLLLTRTLFDSSDGFCSVDQELLFSPHQCSAYAYQLVKTLLDMLRKDAPRQPQLGPEALQAVIDKSLADYCGDGDPKTVFLGCVGIKRIPTQSICEELDKNCDYLRMQQWKLKDRKWKSVIHKFCPKIATRYGPDK